MGTVRNTPAYISAMASDIGDGTPYYITDVAGGFRPAMGAPFYVSSWSGKSNYIPMSPNIGADQSWQDTNDGHEFTLSCSPNGGASPYAYSWAILYPSAPPPYVEFVGASTNQTVYVNLTPTGGLGSEAHCDMQCTVTDGAGNVVASNAAHLSYTFV